MSEEQPTVQSEGTVASQPVAVTNTTPAQTAPKPGSAWLSQLDTLAQEIGKAWKTGRSALEAVQEIRR
jgi:hypothetical protein